MRTFFCAAQIKEDHQKVDEYIAHLYKGEIVSIAELKAGSRRKEASGVWAQSALGLVRRHKVSLAEIAGRSGASN